MDFRLETLKRELNAAVEGMSSEQFLWHPTDKWCAAEVLEHLYLTYTGTIKGLEKVLTGGKPLTTRASFRQRFQTIVVLSFGYLPEGRQAPSVTRPRGLPAETVRNEIGLRIMAMDAILTQCESRIGKNVPLLDHLVLGPLNATQWRKFHLLHGRHHVKQLLRLRENPGQTE
jgi:hypothetical protein